MVGGFVLLYERKLSCGARLEEHLLFQLPGVERSAVTGGMWSIGFCLNFIIKSVRCEFIVLRLNFEKVRKKNFFNFVLKSVGNG